MTRLEITDLVFGAVREQAERLGTTTKRIDEIHASRRAEIIANEGGKDE